MKFKDVNKFPHIYYSVNTSWDYLKSCLNRYSKNFNLDMNPDFQREHVWTENQQIRFVEYMLKEPQSGRDIYFNHPNWMGSYEGQMLLLDGKQRINAALRFLNNEIKVYNTYYKDFEDRIPSGVEFVVNIMCLKNKKDIINWYIQFNSAGTPHSKEELERVKKLI